MRCPNCDSKIEYSLMKRLKDNSYKRKCCNCNIEFTQTYGTRLTNGLIVGIIGVILIVGFREKLDLITNNFAIKILIVAILGGIIGGIFCTIDFPWNKYE